MPREPGTISACLNVLRYVLAFDKMRGGARRSSRRELVHEPMNTRSTGISTMGVPGLETHVFEARLSVAF